jgi:hypothetical protein
MSTEHTFDPEEALAIQEADAWFEYLETTRTQGGSGGYDEVESWAWARLVQRLRTLADERDRVRPAAA